MGRKDHIFAFMMEVFVFVFKKKNQGTDGHARYDLDYSFEDTKPTNKQK